MSANSAAFDHLTGFRWRQGDPSLADAEAQLYDLGVPVSYTHLTLPTTLHECRSRWSPYH